MAFLPASAHAEPRGLILDPAEAARLRALETERIREAQAMVARFFGLPRTGAPSRAPGHGAAPFSASSR